jgi:hypothetical protein
MSILLDKILLEPQVYAAVITAIFGILGILINIVINFWFRNKDYKYKNSMLQLEILESYYIPLEEKIIRLNNCISFFEDDDKMFDVILGKNGAEKAAQVEKLNGALKECKDFFNDTDFKYPYDYKLFLAHKIAKDNIMELCGIREKTILSDEKLTRKMMQSCLEDLVYQIQQYENGVVIKNIFVRCKEKIKLWKSYRARRKTD